MGPLREDHRNPRDAAGETCALRWEDFDATSQRVLIRRAACVSSDVLTIKEPKSGRSRTIHIPSQGLWRGLEEFRQPDGFLFRGWVRDPVRRRELDRRGEEKCWHVYTASRRFGRMIRRLGLLSENGRPYGLHSLRHFVATQLYNQSKDWVQVAKFMGHRDSEHHDEAVREPRCRGRPTRARGLSRGSLVAGLAAVPQPHSRNRGLLVP